MSSVILRNVNLSASASRTASATAERASLDLTLSEGLYGLVGRNGSGKSTLLSFIAGQVGAPLVTGDVHVTGRLAKLDQTPDPTGTLVDLFGQTDALARQRAALAGEFTGDMGTVDWTIDDRLTAHLTRFGLGDVALERPVGSLSGGQRLRAALAACLFDEPDVVLMDEPTNNLDSAGRAVVADALRAAKGVVLVASHDRALLDTLPQIVSLEPDGSARLFGGGWSAFAADRDARRTRAEDTMKTAESGLRQARDAAREAEARAARRARQGRALRDGSQPKLLLDARAQSAENAGRAAARLAARQSGQAQGDLDAARAAVEVVTPVSFALPQVSVASHRRLLSLQSVVFDAGAREIGPLSCDLVGPARLHLRGANGSGKSTLLRLIAGQGTPRAGHLTRHVPVAYLDQDVSLLEPSLPLLDAARAARPELAPDTLRVALAQAGFRGETALKPVASLSGGERLRAGLATVTAGEAAPLLILDEPTNHLDLDALGALEGALRDWQGGLIVVSHDTAFVAAVGVTQWLDL